MAQYFIYRFPFWTFSEIMIYLMLSALDIFPALFHSFFSNNMASMLSWYMMFYFTSCHCCYKTNMVQKIIAATPLMPTKSHSLLLIAFSFCFVETDWIIPSPINISSPKCLLKSGWATKLALAYHSIFLMNFFLILRYYSQVWFI